VILRAILASLTLSWASAPADPAPEQKARAEPVVLSEAILQRLPADYRDNAKSLVTTTPENQERWLKRSDEELAGIVIGQLAAKPGAANFLVHEVEKESSPKLRGRIIQALEGYWGSHPESQRSLERHASSDPDAAVALQALAELRTIRMAELGRLLQSRLALAKSGGDGAGAMLLAREQETRYSWHGELNFPSFMRVPAPVFAVKVRSSSIRVLAFGDFGFGNEAQRATAAAMVDYHKSHPFDFGLTVGDNFYTYGMVSTKDPRWQTQFEQLYGPMHIQIYASLGNHDYGQPDSPAAEILYSNLSPDWRMPSPYYTYTAGPVQFFAIDTIDLTEAELMWLGEELGKSTARWKLVYGHFPIYSATGEDRGLIDKLLPVLKKGQTDIYLCGHHHNLQELKPDGSVHFFVSGGGGAPLYNVNPYERSLYKEKVNGFTVLEADEHRFKVSFIGVDGQERHADTLEK